MDTNNKLILVIVIVAAVIISFLLYQDYKAKRSGKTVGLLTNKADPSREVVDSQLKPGHLVNLTEADKSESINPPSDLLCNWRHCKGGANGGPVKAQRLCPFCHRVGYCCVHCMQQDIYGHVSHNCAQNIKKATFTKV